MRLCRRDEEFFSPYFLCRSLKIEFTMMTTTRARGQGRPSLAKAIAELKTEGVCPSMVQHRQVRYLNNVLEGDHRRLKRILGPKGAFKNRASAYRTLKGMEAMHSLRKDQGTRFAYGHPNRDAVIVSRVFEAA